REPDGGSASVPEKGRVRDPTELLDDGGVDLWSAVAEQVAPERCDAVEQPPTVGVDEVVALARDDHQRIFIAVDGMRREGVPDVGVIPGDKLLSQLRCEVRGARCLRRCEVRGARCEVFLVRRLYACIMTATVVSVHIRT